MEDKLIALMAELDSALAENARQVDRLAKSAEQVKYMYNL